MLLDRINENQKNLVINKFIESEYKLYSFFTIKF